MAGNPGDTSLPEDDATTGGGASGARPDDQAQFSDADAAANANTNADASNQTNAAAQANAGHKPTGKPLAKTFHCTHCGGAVTIRYPGAAMSVVCGNCHSIIDALDENCKILAVYSQKTSGHKPLLPLGSRGKLRDRLWEVIGYMVRSDVSSGYDWDEYLLFNPYYGFRWLTEDQGHWNFVTTIKRKPEQSVSSCVRLDGIDYQLYNSGSAKVEYVIGEFYWRVVMGSTVDSSDFLNAPAMLSMEKNIGEVVWSLGEYISSDEISKAFKPPGELPRPFGVGATQPPRAKAVWEKIRLLFIVFIGVVTVSQVYFWRTRANAHACEYVGSFAPNTKKADVTVPTFTLSEGTSNVTIYTSAPVDNSWFWLGGELVNNDTGVSYPFEQSVEYYHGYDSDGYWSEGGTSSNKFFSSVPGGKYYINLDYESGSFKADVPQDFHMDVYRDVPIMDNYFWTVFFLSWLPFWSWCQMRQEEVARWSNSDFSPYAPKYSSTYSSSSDD